MAYIKYKELTKYFNFDKEIEIDTLPKYVTDYVEEKEKVFASYKNSRDYIVFTNHKIVLFDKTPGLTTKKVHIIPLFSVSSSAISFQTFKADILITLDSGYQLRLSFIKMSADKKGNLRKVYQQMISYQCKVK